MSSIERKHVGPRMCQTAIHNGTIYLAGQVADDKNAPLQEQVRQVLATIDKLLAEAGSSKSRILSAQIWLKDIADFPAMNEIWDKWVDPKNTPARATGQVLLADPAFKVEIIVVAAQG